MTKRTIYFIITVSVFFFSCSSNESIEDNETKSVILQASREAPLGWLYFKLYSDSSFLATNSGMRILYNYHGTFKLNYDTLKLTYQDSVSDVFGSEMLIEKYNLRFLEIPGGLGIDTLEIDLEKLIENKPIDSLELKELKLLQGVWQHSEDKASTISIRDNFGTFYYVNEPFDESDRYRIRWRDKLPQYVDSSVQASFLEFQNKTDTMHFEILGLTDSTFSSMYYPNGRINLYYRKK